MQKRFYLCDKSSESQQGASLMTSSELLNRSMQQIVEDINAKRKRDTAVLEGIK